MNKIRKFRGNHEKQVIVFFLFFLNVAASHGRSFILLGNSYIDIYIYRLYGNTLMFSPCQSKVYTILYRVPQTVPDPLAGPSSSSFLCASSSCILFIFIQRGERREAIKEKKERERPRFKPSTLGAASGDEDCYFTTPGFQQFIVQLNQRVFKKSQKIHEFFSLFNFIKRARTDNSCLLPPCHFLLYSFNTIVTLTEETKQSVVKVQYRQGVQFLGSPGRTH